MKIHIGIDAENLQIRSVQLITNNIRDSQFFNDLLIESQSLEILIECDHGKLKRIISATLGFKFMKTAYVTIKGIEVMRTLRKGQDSSFYYGHSQGKVCLINRVFGL